MNIGFRFLVGVALAFSLSSIAEAATREVGSGRTYSTIAAGVAAANAGDTVLVYPGTYTEWVSWTSPLAGTTMTNVFVAKSGTASSPIIIRASGPGVIIDGQGQRNSCFAMRSQSYVVIDGFECKNYTLIGKGETGVMNTIESHHITIQNNIITNVIGDLNSGDETMINLQSLNDSIIRGNRLNPMQPQWGPIGMRGSWGARNLIEGNHITGVWAGIYISQLTDDYVIRRNYISTYHYYGIWIRDSLRAKVSHNVIENALPGFDTAAILLLDNSQAHPNENHDVFNNTIRNGRLGIQMGTQNGSKLRNNLIMNTSYGIVEAWWSGVTPSTGVQIDYNLIWSSATPFYQSVSFTGTHNKVGVDPMLQGSGSSPSPYYTLRSGSPAINGGDPSTPAGLDFLGVQTGAGSTIEIGAFEFGSGGTPTLSAPTNVRVVPQ